MKKLICFILIVFSVCSLFLIKTFSAPVFAENFCKASVVIEENSGRVLSQNNKDERLAMASTTKIMTALVVLNNCNDLQEKVLIDDRAVGIEGTSMYIRKNEVLTIEELLYGLILPSGNDAAMALAYFVGKGNLQSFVDLMNQTATDLKLANTHFDNPHGLDSKNHYTSAYDLAIITSKAMQNKTFREIVSTKIKQISGNSEVKNRFLRNKQKLLKTLDGCNGVKSGFTDNAGRCLVTSCVRDGMEVICVVLNCPNMFEESAKLINDAFENFSLETIIEPYYYISNIKVENGTKDEVKVYSMKSCKYPLKTTEKTLINIETEIEESLVSPIKKEQIVGKIKVYFENELIFSENIYTMESVDSKDIQDKLKDIINEWFYD